MARVCESFRPGCGSGKDLVLTVTAPVCSHHFSLGAFLVCGCRQWLGGGGAAVAVVWGVTGPFPSRPALEVLTARAGG